MTMVMTRCRRHAAPSSALRAARRHLFFYLFSPFFNGFFHASLSLLEVVLRCNEMGERKRKPEMKLNGLDMMIAREKRSEIPSLGFAKRFLLLTEKRV